MGKICTKCGKPLAKEEMCNCISSNTPDVEVLSLDETIELEVLSLDESTKELEVLTLEEVPLEAKEPPRIIKKEVNKEIKTNEKTIKQKQITKKTFNECLNIIKSFIKNPIFTIEENTNNKKNLPAIIMLILNSLSVGLFVTILLDECLDVLYKFILKASSYITFTSLTTSIEIPYIKTFTITALISFISVILLSIITYLIINKVLKNKTNLKKILSVYGYSSIISTIAFLFATICNLFDIRLGLIILSIGLLLNNYYINHTILTTNQGLDKNKSSYATAVSLVLTLSIIGFIISKI